jgi:hypothetical protein
VLRRLLATSVALGALLLLSRVVLFAIEPRPYMDPSPPWFAMGPHCGDEDNKADPGCTGPGSWRVELFGKTYSKATWPHWPWELL